jgi:hypothetical protein
LLEQLASKFKTLFKNLDQTLSFKPMFSMLWYSTLPCFDVKGVTSTADGEKGVLKACAWKGKDVPCSAIFTQAGPQPGIDVMIAIFCDFCQFSAKNWHCS